jgi:exonuclease SbcC
MRLHRLRLTAFGPFAAEQSVDFDALSAGGLFLLHGPTGGGKTSVLDAVCYALYGQVPGVRPATRLRSDHAAAGTRTEVVLDVTLGGRRLEITRRPEQQRAKKRGSGVTVERAVTLLREHVEGEWRALSKSHQEVGEELRQLLGMSCEQFCQVVLLPQGDFATFLRAGATERAALLGRLFDTRRFRSVEQRLRERKHEAGQELAEGDRRLAALAARMRQAAGEGATVPSARAAKTGAAGKEPVGPAELLAHAAVLRSTARERHTIASVALAHAEAAHAAAALAAERARDLHALQHRYAEAGARAAALAALAPRRATARTALTRAQRATTVEPALTHHAKARAQYEDARAAERTALGALPAELRSGTGLPEQGPGGGAGEGEVGERAADRAGGELSGQARELRLARGGAGEAGARGDGVLAEPARRAGELPVAPDGISGAGEGGARGADRAAGGLARRAGELREALGGLAGAEDVEARARDIAVRRDGLDREERADEDAVRDAEVWLAEWPRVRDGLQARLDGALEAAARAGDLAGEVAAARRRRDAAAERDTLTARLARAEQDEREARDLAADAREAWQDLREQRITGIAAELAAELAGGEPCRVCGSTDHPDPARTAGPHITRADEDAAYARFQGRTAERDRAHEAAVRLRTALDAAAELAGGAPHSELAAACVEVEAAHAAATRAAGTVPDARAALAAAEQERDRRAAAQQSALHRAAARASRREELDAQHARLSDDLARARAGHPSVAARRAHLTGTIALLDRAAHAVRDRADAAQRLAEAEAALTEAAARAGFPTPEEAAAAMLPAPRLWAAEREAAEWSREEAAAESALASAAEALASAVRAEPGPETPAPVPTSGPAPSVASSADATRGGRLLPAPRAFLDALPPADPRAAQDALDAAQLRLRQASAGEDAARRRCDELDALGGEAAAAARELAPARAAYERVARLADLVSATSSENRYRMELETYVLAARLEQVAAAAGVRLERMSGGRYTLVHSDARGGGRSKSGLGLMVVDAWTGTERDTATLSGGETFYASLALALGLADVVTDEAGGMRLDTLFVDEGFGSLDEQALDEVLDVLDGLRERDRAVGIVSHVAELRDRIPARLQVTKGRDGSTLRMRGH